jgi:hypothetical protein
MGFQIPCFVFDNSNAENGWFTVLNQQYLSSKRLCQASRGGDTATRG